METVYRPLVGVTGASQESARVIGIEGHWGRDPRAAAPAAPAVANPILPTAQYGYDSALGLWIPVNVSGGYIVEKFSELIANLLSSNLAQTADLTDDADAMTGQLGSLLDLVNTRLGGNQSAYLWQSLLNSVAGLGFRKILGVDAGAYVAPAAGGNVITYTGVNLTGKTPFVAWNLTERTLHLITSVTDPVGATPGNITLATPAGVASTAWLIPYLSVPHAYETTGDDFRVKEIAPAWAHYVEPTIFINETATRANNTYQFGPFPALDYGQCFFEIAWGTAAASARTFSFAVFGKMNPNAWAAAGAIPAAYNIGTAGAGMSMEVTAGSTAWGAAGAVTGLILSRVPANTYLFDSYMVEMTVAASDANSSYVYAYYGLSGSGR